MIGGKCDVAGDRNYDYSKVLQSLYGYDYVISDNDSEEAGNKAYLEGLRDKFWDFLEEKGYLGGEEREEEIMDAKRALKLLTASHFFAIVPLHQNRDHQMQFLAKAKGLFAEAVKD